MKKIAIDLLGGDNPEEELLKGAVKASKDHPDLVMAVFGTKDRIQKTLEEEKADCSHFEIHEALPLDPSIHGVMDMMRFKGHSSLTDALEFAKNDPECEGIVSPGPTGMLLVSSLRRVGMLDGLSFPALGALLINIHQKPVLLLDCGANTDVSAQKLYEFGVLGNALMKSYLHVSSPRIGLMNVGKEDTKGDKLRKEAFPLFKNASFDFIGNLEGSDVFLDKADVVVCDGFSGNLILKNAEATALICKKIVELNGKDDPSCQKAAKMIYSMFAYNELGGAIVLGAKRIIMKAHGAANAKSIASVINDIDILYKGGYLAEMEKAVSSK